MASIFVQLASYHDYELPHTILDALATSSGNHQINFGVHHNYYENNDIELPEVLNLKAEISRAPDNLGMGMSRAVAHQFYNGEDYYLQVDSHTRFRELWDETYISEVKRYQRMGFAKPLLTTYPRNYWYEDGVLKSDKTWNVSCISFEEDKDKFFNMRVPSQTAWNNPYGNVFSRSVSGGSIFTVGPFIVPNRNTHSVGEEILIAARAFTAGYDLLIPKENQLSHLYYDHTKPHANGRRMVWQDFPEKSAEMEKSGIAEVQRIFLSNVVGPDGLGTERSLEEFEIFSGLDFSTGTVIGIDNLGLEPSQSKLAGLACPVGIWGDPLTQ